jgi:SAM-dependent methyltransferase
MSAREPLPVGPFISAYLRESPLFMAIVRGVECQMLRSAGPLEGPVLDLGCGDGLFAAVACEEAPAVGLDPSPAALREAQARYAHETLSCGSATELPFRAGSFQTVLCNSVIEHIPAQDAALRECHRVLRPGGRLLLTTPSHHFGPMLLGSRLLRGVGLRRAADAYAAWFNAHSLHFHTLSREAWLTKLAAFGFTVRDSHYYLDVRAHSVFDAMHYLSWWRWLHRRMTGRWVGGWAPLHPLWTWCFAALTKNRWPREDGPYLYLDAERNA